MVHVRTVLAPSSTSRRALSSTVGRSFNSIFTSSNTSVFVRKKQDLSQITRERADISGEHAGKRCKKSVKVLMATTPGQSGREFYTQAFAIGAMRQ